MICLAEADNRPKSQHRYNVQEQQAKYNTEIGRIWRAQWDSLSNPVEPVLTEAEKEEDKPSPAKKRRISEIRDMSPSVALSPSPATPTPNTPLAIAGPPATVSPGMQSRGSSVDREGSIAPENGQRVLRIRRLASPCVPFTFSKF